MKNQPKIAVVSGEISGDQYASLLVLHLKKIIPSAEIIGTGGNRLKHSGIRIIAENPFSGSFGISSVIKNISHHIRFLNQCASAIKKEMPDLIVFIDNPGLNLNLAKMLHDFRKIYYIPPKIWAHNYQRVFLIRHLFESVIVIFPFEKRLYEKEGVSVHYFGHPVADLIDIDIKDENFYAITGIKKADDVVGIFPGSRSEEVSYILPVLVKAAKNIIKNHRVSFVVSCAEETLFSLIKKIMEEEKFDCPVWTGSAHIAARHSRIALSASGTMNLELALLGVPMIVFYRMSPFNYIIARTIVQLRYVSPVNIICGKKIIDEFIQNVNWHKFQKVFQQIFEYGNIKRKMQIECFEKLKQQIGNRKVTQEVAEFISTIIK